MLFLLDVYYQIVICTTKADKSRNLYSPCCEVNRLKGVLNFIQCFIHKIINTV